MLVSETPAGPARVKRRSGGSLYSADRPFSEKVMGTALLMATVMTGSDPREGGVQSDNLARALNGTKHRLRDRRISGGGLKWLHDVYKQ